MAIGLLVIFGSRARERFQIVSILRKAHHSYRFIPFGSGEPTHEENARNHSRIRPQYLGSSEALVNVTPNGRSRTVLWVTGRLS